MEFYEKDFGKILKANAQAQRHDLLPEGTDCFRVYDRNLVQFPVTVDLYGKYAKVVDYGEEPLEDSMRDLCINICTRMLYLDEGKVLYSYRAKRQDKEQHEKQKDESIFVEVHENNHLFKVDLSSHIDTGLFLDHSLTRRFIEEQSAGRSVLNLFSYTGSFSVYAACGGATSVTSVDMSSSYSKWAEENLRANGYEGSFYKCVTKEAGKFIFEALEKGEKYDIVIFDPPSFSNSHKMEGNFDVARDYGQWIKKICGLLNKKGFILFSTNLSTFRMDKRTLKGLSVKDITDATSAPGFVKGRKGTVRSWIMTFDEDSLNLDWSEPEKKQKDEKRESPRRGSYKERERGERTYRRDLKEDHYKEGRSYKYRGEKSPYNKEKGERSSYSHRPRYEKNYSERSREDRPYRERRSYRDEGSYEEGRSFREKRSYNEERPYREHSYRESRPNREERPYREERPRRFYEGEEKREKRFFEDRPYERKSYDKSSFNRSSDRRDSKYSRDRERDNKPPKKPYGFDSFKPARSREDSRDFFWNSEDLDYKKKED